MEYLAPGDTVCVVTVGIRVDPDAMAVPDDPLVNCAFVFGDAPDVQRTT